MTRTHPELAQHMLARWSLHQAVLTPIAVGHINETYKVVCGDDAFVLQRVSTIFRPEINADIEVITQHLARAAITTPLVVRTDDNQPFALDAQGQCWRVLTFIDGQCFEKAQGPEMVASAGALLGRFHAALQSLRHTFVAPRLGVHDTPRHLKALADALLRHTTHPAYKAIAPLARDILEVGQSLDAPDDQAPVHIVHGDAKLANVIFRTPTHAVALVDLDTLAHMPMADELGDALRSWCNVNGEAPGDSDFDCRLFEAALSGWAAHAGNVLTAREVAALPGAPARIALELASRFARDALEESYFGWDATRYNRSWEHQLDRARSQWAVAVRAKAQHQALKAVCERLFQPRLTLY